jgi:hypothetical protein
MSTQTWFITGASSGLGASGPMSFLTGTWRGTEASPVLAGLVGASVQGRVALGPRAGGRVRRLGDEPDLGHATSRGPRQAQLDGFDLHANVWVSPKVVEVVTPPPPSATSCSI